MDSTNISVFIVVIQILMGIISLIGGAMLMSMQSSIRELREADQKLANKVEDCAKLQDMRDWRKEQRDDLIEFKREQESKFSAVFQKLDAQSQLLSKLVERTKSD